jgi:hypothetical protein
LYVANGELPAHVVRDDVGFWMEPTVTTAGSNGDFFRLTIV